MALKIPLSGLIHITGDSDSGKTSMALECGAEPSRILFVDADVKGRATVNQLRADGVEFGRYVPWVTETRGMKEAQLYKYGMDIIDSIKPNQYDAVCWDVWSEMSRTFKPEVAAHRKTYRDQWSAMGTIAGAEEWQVSHDLEAEAIDKMLANVPLVILVTHLKPYYINNKKVDGKFIPDCRQSLVTKSRMRVWLRRNPNGRPVPIGLVLKRIDKKEVRDGRIRTINVLPQKLIPRPEDDSLWSLIEYYWEHPWGDKKLTEEFALSDYELSILDGTLTTDQKLAMRMAMLELEEEAAEAQAILTGRNQPEARADELITEDIKALLADGKTNDEIRATVPDATLPLILKARKA